MYKKILSIALVLIFALSCAGISYAETQTLSDYYQNRLQETMSKGFTRQEAEHYIRIEKILKEMEATGQKVDLVDGKVQIVNPDNLKKGISKEDEKFIIKLFEDQLKKPKVSREEKIEKLNKEIKENPGRSKYKVEFEDGSSMEFEIKRERLSDVPDDKVKLFMDNTPVPNETEMGTAYTFPADGRYLDSSILRESHVTGWGENMLAWSYDVSNNGYHVKV